MIYTGGGGIVFLVWLAVVTGGYYVIAAFEVDGWLALGGACAIAAVVTYVLGRSLNPDVNEHTFGLVPAQWIGLAAPAFFGVVFGIAELSRSL
jgi:hypothetical protein